MTSVAAGKVWPSSMNNTRREVSCFIEVSESQPRLELIRPLDGLAVQARQFSEIRSCRVGTRAGELRAIQEVERIHSNFKRFSLAEGELPQYVRLPHIQSGSAQTFNHRRK